MQRKKSGKIKKIISVFNIHYAKDEKRFYKNCVKIILQKKDKNSFLIKPISVSENFLLLVR